MTKTKELIICLISVLALILAITTTVFATEDPDDLDTLLGNNTNSEENNDFEQIGEAEDINNNSNTNTNMNTNTNNNTNQTTSIPYTGIDYSVLVIIAICGGSAIYAYKKIRDYQSL